METQKATERFSLPPTMLESPESHDETGEVPDGYRLAPSGRLVPIYQRAEPMVEQSDDDETGPWMNRSQAANWLEFNQSPEIDSTLSGVVSPTFVVIIIGVSIVCAALSAFS